MHSSTSGITLNINTNYYFSLIKYARIETYL